MSLDESLRGMPSMQMEGKMRGSSDKEGMSNYCGSYRSERTQFDKQLQTMWCPSCSGPTGPTGPTGPNVMGGQNTKRYSSAVQDKDFRGNVKVAGVN